MKFATVALCVLLLLCAARTDAATASAKAFAYAKAGTGSTGGRGSKYFKRTSKRKMIVKGLIRCSGGTACCWRYRACGSVVKQRPMRMRAPACRACYLKCKAMSPRAWKPYVLCWRSCHSPCRKYVWGKSRRTFRYIKLCPVHLVRGKCPRPRTMIARSGRRVLPRYKK